MTRNFAFLTVLATLSVSVPGAASELKFKCAGSEPFWSAVIDGDRSSVTDDVQQVTQSTPTQLVPGLGVDSESILVFKTSRGGVFTVVKQGCSDEAGNVSPYSVVYADESQSIRGACCTRIER